MFARKSRSAATTALQHIGGDGGPAGGERRGSCAAARPASQAEGRVRPDAASAHCPSAAGPVAVVDHHHRVPRVASGV
jgi:hypothetical protein